VQVYEQPYECTFDVRTNGSGGSSSSGTSGTVGTVGGGKSTFNTTRTITATTISNNISVTVVLFNITYIFSIFLTLVLFYDVNILQTNGLYLLNI
jgi:hypothetical protein